MGYLDRITADEEHIDPSVEQAQDVKDSFFKTVRFTLWQLRKVLFTRERSGSDSVIVPLSVEQAEDLFAQNHFEPGWWLSYSFRDEVLNMRRPEYRTPEQGKPRWWQAHIRGYQSETDGSHSIELTCHIEPEPKEYPTEHLTGPVDYDQGTRLLVDLLQANNIEHEYISRSTN